MNSGVLNFALGLATAPFIAGVAKASGAIKGFGAVAVETGAAIDVAFAPILEMLAPILTMAAMADGVMDSIGKGAGLEELHRRTGTSISDLYELQEGFKMTGLNADDVSETLFQMQKSLGGVNENGESTSDIFSRMGLSIATLKKQNAPAQIESILNALNKLGTSDAAAAAEGIFGRMGAENIIQLAHSSKEVAAAMADAVEEGENWQRIAPLFEEVHIALVKIKELGEGFFAGIALGIAPALKAGLNWLESFKSTLTEIGQKIGKVFTGITEAFREGNIGELLNLTFAASVEFLTNMILNTLGSASFWTGIFDTMVGAFLTVFPKVFEVLATMGQVLAASLDTAIQRLLETIGKTKLGFVLGMSGYKAETFSQNLTDEKKSGQDGMESVKAVEEMGKSFFSLGTNTLSAITKSLIANSGGPEQDKFKNFWAGLMARTPGLPKSADGGGGDDKLQRESYTYTPAHDSLEKMGFVHGGAGGNDAASQTARNTSQMVGLMQTTVTLLSGQKGQAGSINKL